MSSLKTLLICVVLAAVAYGVYVSISRSPETADTLDMAPLLPETEQGQTLGPSQATPRFSGGGSPGQTAWDNAPAARIPAGPAADPTRRFAPMDPAVDPTGRFAPMNPTAAGTTNAGLPSFTPPQNPPTPVDVHEPRMSPPYPGGNQLPGSPLNSLTNSQPYSAPATAPQSISTDTYPALWQEVQSKLDQERFREALQTLTRWYHDPSMSEEQTRQVIDLLDQLAGTVIYSREHWLEDPYVVRAGDTAERIAEACRVPWQVLARINGLEDTQQPQPGQVLKIVSGPFHAQVDLVKYELTLVLGDLYAGRFPIGVGSDFTQLEGSYVVSNTTENPKYSGPDGMTIVADDSRNPLGEYWIGLATQEGHPGLIGIHGTNDPANVRRLGGRGSICLGDQDINDVFGILSVGSRVTVTGRQY